MPVLRGGLAGGRGLQVLLGGMYPSGTGCSIAGGLGTGAARDIAVCPCQITLGSRATVLVLALLGALLVPLGRGLVRLLVISLGISLWLRGAADLLQGQGSREGARQRS